jgi:hypothetical protein
LLIISPVVVGVVREISVVQAQASTSAGLIQTLVLVEVVEDVYFLVPVVWVIFLMHPEAEQVVEELA